ncbi:MAG: leucine--tRNA ligase [bacterium]
MAATYDFKTIETKWQQKWLEERLFAVRARSARGNMYVLDMFPYPSGDGLHVGHAKIYTASDVISRYLRMKGFNVLHPTGWDAFGLPTENTAIKKGIRPASLTATNIERFRKQMRMMGFSYDWEREINTTDPKYYKWTQWIFLKLFQMGLAYQDTVSINWCPGCKTGLANEEVEDGKCERCGTAVEQKPMQQWMLKITKYADRLLAGLDGLDWPDFIIDLQRNWIGRSEGTEIDWQLTGSGEVVKIFTTRPDTIFGATFMAMSPEHPYVVSLQKSKKVEEYVARAKEKTDLQRTAAGKDITGVQLEGVMAINPMTGEEVPVWVADYVLKGYGTGAIMAVPAHDERDFAFAQKYKLPVIQVIQPTLAVGSLELPYVGDGVLINSGDYSGVKVQQASQAISEALQLRGLGRRKVHFKLRDWVFSRQRYWGEPIPIIHCDNCGAVPVPEEELPVELPEVDKYEPTGTGESPLALAKAWVNVKCPTCSRAGRRETDTMPQWAGSSWYWLRYVDPINEKSLVGEGPAAEWLPVDLYVGGAEHAVLHLLYARFWNLVLFDNEVVANEEPFKRFRSVGLLLGNDGQKMSKSRGNVITPDEVVKRLGADALRVYVMFMGPFDHAMAWSEAGLNGASRFLQRVKQVFDKLSQFGEKDSPELELRVHQTIRRVSEGTEQFRFNTAVAALMELLNELEKCQAVTRLTLETFVLLLAPYAPHMAEELWSQLGHAQTLMYQDWPKFDQALLAGARVTLPVQVNGKVRGELLMSAKSTKAQAEVAAKELANVKQYLALGEITKIIYVEGRMINFVVGKNNSKSGASSSS